MISSVCPLNFAGHSRGRIAGYAAATPSERGPTPASNRWFISRYGITRPDRPCKTWGAREPRGPRRRELPEREPRRGEQRGGQHDEPGGGARDREPPMLH